MHVFPKTDHELLALLEIYWDIIARGEQQKGHGKG